MYPILLAADEVLIVTTPEPHAMMMLMLSSSNAYFGNHSKKAFDHHKVDGDLEAGIIASRLKRVVSQYLQEEMEFLGGIEEDKAISRSLKKQCPLLLLEPNCTPARSIAKIADKIIGLQSPKQQNSIGGFVRKLLDVFKTPEDNMLANITK